MKEIENAEIENAVLMTIEDRHGPADNSEDVSVVIEVIRLTLGALDEQRATARAQNETVGDLTFRDFTKYPDELRSLIDRGVCDGIVGLHRLREPGKPDRVGMMSGGITSEQAFEMMCVVRRTLMMQLGLVDREPYAEATQPQLDPRTLLGAAPEEPKVQPMNCVRCGIDWWGVLNKCAYADCPHGLYSR